MNKLKERAEELMEWYNELAEHDDEFNMEFKDSAYSFLEDFIIAVKEGHITSAKK